MVCLRKPSLLQDDKPFFQFFSRAFLVSYFMIKFLLHLEFILREVKIQLKKKKPRPPSQRLPLVTRLCLSPGDAASQVHAPEMTRVHSGPSASSRSSVLSDSRRVVLVMDVALPFALFCGQSALTLRVLTACALTCGFPQTLIGPFPHQRSDAGHRSGAPRRSGPTSSLSLSRISTFPNFLFVPRYFLFFCFSIKGLTLHVTQYLLVVGAAATTPPPTSSVTSPTFTRSLNRHARTTPATLRGP